MLLLTQCVAYRKAAGPEKTTASVGLEGLKRLCISCDTIHSMMISKAEAVIVSGEERYEAQVSLYTVKDSIIYVSAVNGGFEILRASVEQDSIMVVDRLNKVVYITAVNRRFGYQNPVNFKDLENIVSRYSLCDDIDRARESSFTSMEFSFDVPDITKKITVNRESLRTEKFEFYHQKTGNFLLGERDNERFRIHSNFMLSDFEIVLSGGTASYNRAQQVKMEVNPRKYTFVNL
jgi:hypothetical protein